MDVRVPSTKERMLVGALVLLVVVLSSVVTGAGERACRGKPMCTPGTIPPCPPGEPGNPADGNCPVDPDPGNDRLLCCSEDAAGNQYQVWCVSAAPGRPGQYVNVFIPAGGPARAIGACWFTAGGNRRIYRFTSRNTFDSIRRDNHDQYDHDAHYEWWLYEYFPLTNQLVKTGVKDDGTSDPDHRIITPPTDFTRGLRCSDPDEIIELCPPEFDLTAPASMDDGTPHPWVEGDRCEEAIPIECPSVIVVPLEQYADDYNLDDCAPEATEGADAYCSVQVSTGHLELAALPTEALDVAIIVSAATCDSCLAGVNSAGVGEGETLVLDGLPPGDYRVCIKAVHGTAGDVLLDVSCGATMIEKRSWGTIKRLYR